MATKTTKPLARPKRTKTEIEEEFSEIRKEVAATRETTDKKTEETSKLREAEIRRAVEGISVEDVVTEYPLWALIFRRRSRASRRNWSRK